jgi:Protein kinase domain
MSFRSALLGGDLVASGGYGRQMPVAGATVIAGRYRLGRKLGQGGMGVVWAAVDEVLDRPVAVKEVVSPTGDQRAFQEAQAAARLASPHVVTIHDLVTDQGKPWIVMELVPGRSLATLLKDGPLTEPQAVAIAVNVLKALVTAHDSGVLHRDVKPSNILLDEDRVLLSDFGIAAVDGRSTLTGSQDLIGSLEYLAPERMLGDDATPAADLWSLGVTLYRAVEGKSPYARADLPSALAAAMTREPDPPKRVRTLWPLIERLLSRQPGDRGTARDALALLGTDEPVRPAPRPRKRLVLLCAAVAVVASFAGFVVRPEPPALVPPALTGEFLLQKFDAFQLNVPQGWLRTIEGQTVTWKDPRPGVVRHIRIGPVEIAPVSPVRYQQDTDAEMAKQPGYHRIMLADMPAADGHRATADLEYRYEVPATESTRTYSRVEVSSWGRLYEVRFVVNSSQDWQESEHIRDTVLDTVRLQ